MKHTKLFNSKAYNILTVLAGGIASIIGLMVLVGWHFDISTLKSVLPNAVSMKANTAALFILLGISLILLRYLNWYTLIIVRIIALVIILVGTQALVQNIFGWDIGLDEILYKEQIGSINMVHPGLMALYTALNFTLLGFTIIFLTLNRLRYQYLIIFSLLFSFTISIIGLIGYFTGFAELVGHSAFTKMAIYTAGAFFIVCIGILSNLKANQQNPITIEQKMLAGLTISGAVIIYISLFSISGIQLLLKSNNWIDAKNQTKQELTKTLSLSIDVETCARGYVITGEEMYEKQLLNTSEELLILIDNLYLQLLGNEHQLENLSKLKFLISERILFSNQLKDTRRNRSLKKAVQIVSSGEGKTITDSIKIAVDKMLAIENRLIDKRINDEKVKSKQAQVTIYISVIFQLLLISVVLTILIRNIKAKKKVEETLRESELKHRILFENSPDAYLIIIDKIFVDCNKAAENMLLGSRTQIIGKSPDELSPEFQPDGTKSSESANDKIREAFRNEKNTFEWMHRRFDGVDFLVEVSIASMIYSGKPALFITWRDITERNEDKKLIQLNNSELTKLNADKNRYISILAHDLKSPFNSILGFLELLTENIRTYDINKIEKHLSIVNNSAKQTYNLLEDILHWARSQSGKIPYNPQVLNFWDISNEIIEILKPNASSKGIIIVQNQEHEVPVFADADMLKTILRNLISNAIKFTNKGGEINLKMETIATVFPNYQIISVSDNGIGITPEILDELFDISKTNTTKGTANESGSGLGLLLCKEFVEKHNGKIWVESEEGKGSTFYFTVPIRQ